MIYHVVAVANNRVIGKNNRLPWHFSADLKFFKHLTMGQTVLMGRKTFESIGKPLPGRENFVLSRNPSNDTGSRFFNSVKEAVGAVKTEKCFIIGGAQIFEQTMDLVDGIYMTRIYADYEGDTFYPEVPKRFKVASTTMLQEQPKIEVIFYKGAD